MKTIDIVASSMFPTYDIYRTWNSILKMTWCHWFYYPDFHCSQNGLDTKFYFIL